MNPKPISKMAPYFALIAAVAVGIIIGRSASRAPAVTSAPEVSTPVNANFKPETPVASESAGMDGATLAGKSERQLRQIAERNALSDPKRAVQKAGELSRMDRYAYLDSVFSAWGAKDGNEAANWAGMNLKGSAKSEALTSIAGTWAEENPMEAAEWFNNNTAGETREEALYDILDSWGRANPEAALEWTAALDPNVKTWVMDGLAEGWGSVDPVAAVAAGMQFADTDFGQDFLVAAASQWAAKNPAEVAAWASGLRDNRLQAALFLDLGTEWGISDPGAALAWVEGIADEKLRRNAEVGFASGWAEIDPEAALNWAANGLSNPKQSQRVTKEVIIGWTEVDPAGVASYLETLSPGEQTDSIIKTFSKTAADLDPYAAISWAATISHEATRIQQMQNLINDWLALDGDQARNALKGMDLPEKLQSVALPK